MVRLDQNRRAAAQLLGNQRSDMAEVHQRGNLHSLMRCRKSEVVDSVMRDREGMKINLPDAEIFARLDLFYPILERGSSLARFVTRYVELLPEICVASLGGDIDRTVNRSQQYAQAARVIAVFVSNQHCIKAMNILANEREPAHCGRKRCGECERAGRMQLVGS